MRHINISRDALQSCMETNIPLNATTEILQKPNNTYLAIVKNRHHIHGTISGEDHRKLTLGMHFNRGDKLYH
jgi:hypothetical protein